MKFAPLHCSLIGLALIALAPLVSAQSGGKTLYKWVDEKGVTHYGDRVPPQYSKRERHILNNKGVEVGRLEAEKTPAQRAEEEAQLQAIANSRQRDQILLTTYVSVDQIEQLRDQRLDLIDGQIRVAAQYLDTLQSRLRLLHAETQAFRPYSSNTGAGPMPDDMAKDLVRTVNEIRVQERSLAGKHREHAQLLEKFAADIERYKQLRDLK